MARCISDSTLGSVPDTYLYALAQNGDNFATIGSDDRLRMFDISLRPLENGQQAHSGISCLSSHKHGFATAGRDGIVRWWDIRTRGPNAQAQEPKARGFSSIACHDHYVAAGTEYAEEGLGTVSVLLYDTRSLSAPVRNYAESHTDTITQLAFHPTEPNLLMSGSTDGLVSVFDVNIQEEEDALQTVLNPRSAVHCAGFLTSTTAYVATTDEHFSIYSLAENDNTFVDFGDVREKASCTYIVSVLNGSSPAIACGHNINETLSIVELDVSRSGFGRSIDLPRAHGEELVRDLILFDQQRKAISCGEDGHVKVWDLASASS